MSSDIPARVLEPVDLVSLDVNAKQEFVIENIVAPGHVTSLVAPGGAGKTFLAQEFARGVLLGQPAIGLECEQGGVAWLDGEGSPTLFKRRAMALELPYGRIRFFDTLGWDLRSELDVEAIGRATEGCRLIVVDSLRAHTAGADENDSKDMTTAIVALRMVAAHTQAGILLVHHTGKDAGRGGRGSTAIRDQVDMQWTMGFAEGDPDDKRRWLDCRRQMGGKARLIEERDPYWFSIKGWRGTITVQEAAPYEKVRAERAKPQQDNYRDVVLRALHDQGPMHVRDLKEAAGLDAETKNGTFYRALASIKADKLAADEDSVWTLRAAEPNGTAPAETLQIPSANGGNQGAISPNGTGGTNGTQSEGDDVPSREAGGEALGTRSLGAYDEFDPDDGPPSIPDKDWDALLRERG